MNLEITMHTRDIADIVNQVHSQVVKDVRAILYELGEDSERYRDGDGYRLNRRLTTILASGYSIEMRARMVDRLEQLETQHNTLPNFSDPVAAARAWADAQEQLTLAAPKVKLAEQLTDTTNLYGLREVSAMLEIKEKELKKLMFEYGYWYKDQATGQTRAFAHHRALFPLKTEIINNYPRSRLMITGDGLSEIYRVMELAE